MTDNEVDFSLWLSGICEIIDKESIGNNITIKWWAYRYLESSEEVIENNLEVTVGWNTKWYETKLQLVWSTFLIEMVILVQDLHGACWIWSSLSQQFGNYALGSWELHSNVLSCLRVCYKKQKMVGTKLLPGNELLK